jgi:5-methyltetrahydropteroyltriglutamate--homocysteine methyltransferase
VSAQAGIPTEPIGSIPRPPELVAAVEAVQRGQLKRGDLERLYDAAIRDTIRRFEASGSPVVTDGEQRKHDSFWTYGVNGLPNLRQGGFSVQFSGGHSRVLPVLVDGPFRVSTYADTFLAAARQLTTRPVKQAVISASALSLLYPEVPLPGYPREAFLEDVLTEHVTDIRRCLALGAHVVQVDFTEGRLAAKIDPSGELLAGFVDLNNMALERLEPEERQRIGVHSCPGGDCDSTHSADVDYASLIPSLFEIEAKNFYLQLASEPDRPRVLALIGRHLKPGQRVFVGVIDPIDPVIETAEIVRDRVLEAARFIRPENLGTTDDCGFSPFCDDVSTTRDVAFAKITARVRGTALASRILGIG